MNTESNPTQEKSKSKLEPKPITLNMYSMSMSKRMRVYGVPIISVLVFFGILAFTTIPSINEVFASFDERDALQIELENKRIELKEVQALSVERDKNSDLLRKLDVIIPTARTEVVEFEKKVRDISGQSSVEVSEVLTGERILLNQQNTAVVDPAADPNADPNAQASTSQLRLVQIPMEFKMTGPLDNFKSMLNRIYNNNDFIVITRMRLDNDLTRAEMELQLSKYQYLPLPTGEANRALLDSVSHQERPEQSVIDFIIRKSNVEGI